MAGMYGFVLCGIIGEFVMLIFDEYMWVVEIVI